MINTKEQLVESFKELHAIEKKARDYYAGLLLGDVTSHEREVVQEIHDDEVRHMEIVEEILGIIKEHK